MSADAYDFREAFKTNYISPQKGTPLPVSESMKVQLQSNPPLGQVTPGCGSGVVITTILEVSRIYPSDGVGSWQVALWHSVDGAEWTHVDLSPLKPDDEPQTLESQPPSLSRFYSTALVQFKTSLQFTLKFRHSEDEAWRWIRDEQGLGDGYLITGQSNTEPVSLSDLIPNLNKEWQSLLCVSQSPQSELWSLQTTIPSAEDDKSTFKDLEIGTPWGSYLRWFAIVRLWSPWLAPRQGKEHFSLDKDAILCSFLSNEGKNLVFLALSGVNNVETVFKHTKDGGICMHARNDSTASEKVTILVSVSTNFDRAVAAVMYHARTLVARTTVTTPEWDEELKSLDAAVTSEWKENWYDGLGFCTWNAIGQQLTHQKILDAVDKLEKHKINITSLIIDDNWQSIDYKGASQFQYGWSDFEAEPKAFPNGLKATVSRIREKHPGIQHVAVWHALLGYWGGLSPSGKIASTYKTVEVDRQEAERRNLPLGGKITVVAKEDVARFYDDFYSFLAGAGVDAVKTDAQFMVDTFTSASARRGLIKTYMDAWNITSLRYFSIKAISCMSQFPQSLFHSQMPRNRPALLVRNSDDFFPNIPESHPWHVWSNAYNSIFMKYLNVLPDWDMFQTVHEYSGFHAAARCVSGGPIYITDVPGEHNIDLIGQMTGVTPKGKTIIFRPSVLGRSLHPYMGYDDDLLLKVGSYNGGSETGTPILAIFNISARPLTELIPLSSFPGTVAHISYVIRAHTTGKVSQATQFDAPNSLLAVPLDVRGYEIFCALPASHFTGKKHGDIWVANLGLVGKMTGCAAIIGSSISKRENETVALDIRLKALGVLGVYISSLPEMSVEGDFMVMMHDLPVPAETVRLSKNDACVLEVDVEAAWRAMGLENGWRNEVEAKLYFSA